MVLLGEKKNKLRKRGSCKFRSGWSAVVYSVRWIFEAGHSLGHSVYLGQVMTQKSSPCPFLSLLASGGTRQMRVSTFLQTFNLNIELGRA